MKEEIDAVQGETVNLRLNLLQEKTHKKDLIKENSLLVQKIQIYRRMVGELPNGKETKKKDVSPNVSANVSPMVEEISNIINRDQTGSPCKIAPVASQT
jgi:hypothetical protein